MFVLFLPGGFFTFLVAVAHSAPHEALLTAAAERSAAAAARGTTVVVEESRLLSSSNVTLRTDQ